MIKSKNVYLKTLSELNQLIRSKEWSKFLVVTGKQSFFVSGADNVISELQLKIQKRFYDFDTNPQYDDLVKGLSVFENGEFDALIAIGGGSVIDVGKLISYFQTKNNLIRYFSGKDSPSDLKGRRDLSVIAIPTTSGAGSESTHFAVLYKNKIKHSIASELLLPDYYLLIPKLTYNMSAELTGLSGIDAFSQAVESYWSVNSTSISREYALKAIKILWKYLPVTVIQGDEKSRKEVQVAANLAGKAINISKTTAPHAISYTMTALYGIAHGQAVCITLPFFLTYNYDVTQKDNNDPRGIDFVKARISEIAECIDCKSIGEAEQAIKGFILRLGLQISLKSLSISEGHQFRSIKSNINYERLKNNPRNISDKFIDQMFEEIK